MKTPTEELIEDLKIFLPPSAYPVLNNFESHLEKEKQMVVDVIEWYEDLTPVQKVSAWSKSGETKGLFNMDSIQLADKYYNKKFSK